MQALLGSFLEASRSVPCVGLAGTRYLARRLGLTECETMQGLLHQDIWPKRFLRNRDSFCAEAQARLLGSRVLVAGCGGLGGHLTGLLARLGVGAFVLCDYDVFDESNLNRQLFCTEKTVGLPKVEVCRDRLMEIASYLDVRIFPGRLDSGNLEDLLKGTDACADCLDSVSGKQMLKAAADRVGVPYLHGAVDRHEGLAYCSGGGGQPTSSLYAAQTAGDGESAAAHVLTVAGTAVLMASLLLRDVLAITATGQTREQHLFHLDVSLPELERFVMEQDMR